MQCDCKNGNSEVSFFHHRVNYSPVCFLRGLLQYNRFNLKSSLRGEAAIFYTHLRCAVRSPKAPAGCPMHSASTGASPCADCIGCPMTALRAKKRRRTHQRQPPCFPLLSYAFVLAAILWTGEFFCLPLAKWAEAWYNMIGRTRWWNAHSSASGKSADAGNAGIWCMRGRISISVMPPQSGFSKTWLLALANLWTNTLY